MSSFPDDIYFEILLKVPVKSLLVCKCVSKTWCSQISSPRFVKMHLSHTIQRKKPNLMLTLYDFRREVLHRNVSYTIDHDSLGSLLSTNQLLEYAVEIDYPFKRFRGAKLIGSCDGLVCLFYGASDSQFFCLWNPATREYKELPESYITHSVCMVAFGYDYKNGDYKLLLAGNYTETLFEVYSLKSNSWRTIENVPYEFDGLKPSGVVVNGNFHWLALRQGSYDAAVVSLDIDNKIIKEIELPKDILDEGLQLRSLGVLEGCLCVLVDAINVRLEVWVLQDYGVRESWNKRCVITHDRIMNCRFATLISVLKSDKILFRVSDNLVIYDPKNRSVIEPNIPRSMNLWEEECFYESLVPLWSRTYVTGEEGVNRMKKKLKT